MAMKVKALKIGGAPGEGETFHKVLNVWVRPAVGRQLISEGWAGTILIPYDPVRERVELSRSVEGWGVLYVVPREGA